MPQRIGAAIMVLACVMVAPSLAQTETPATMPGAPAAAFPKPDRPVASIISPIWADEKGRDAAAEFDQVFRKLAIKKGMTVADIGAGSGYYSVRLSAALGPSGRVLAQDVRSDYLDGLRARVAEKKLANIDILLGAEDDPKLPVNSVDTAVLIHMYHEIAQPFAFLYNLAPAIKPNGKVGIVDLDQSTPQHGTPPKLLRCELAAVGYREISFTKLSGNVGYLAIFEPPLPENRPAPDKIRPCKSS